MSVAALIAPSETLSEKQRAALLKLLVDEDPAIYHAVRDKILSYGPQVVSWLETHRLAGDPHLRRRSIEIIQHFGRQETDNEFLSFCLKHGEELDLEEGAWLLARTQYPEISLEGYKALLDDFAGELRDGIDPEAAPREMLAFINEYLFGELGFAGNEKNYYDPENSYLNRVLDRRTGNPINLSLLYILLGRRLHLPITGIGLPGHFICRYQSSSAEIFIDAFHSGKFMDKADCVQYLVNGKYSLRDDCLSPVSPRRMLLRICGNLHQIYLQLQKPEETTRLQRYLVALAR
ncbi:MAG TPA: transglutaminase-like domain-containing protein [Verrucomicrobiae bacterium]|nr:transglutaminase-like domain-containing protein [Verrucomicrobiae bacterium]